ncbi:SCO4225 family membrane protein [Streptomyces sp. NPDC056543]|uniref:SCO4225 family membrane protein n=1 Tax=unclassified Streptomyces TaxID=2593676 RepID=UPI0036C33999
MERRWSKVEMWVPGSYLALVLAMQLWVVMDSRTGGGFAGVWPLLATAPVSLLVLGLFGPAKGATTADPAPEVVPHDGSQPPTPLPSEFPSVTDPLPADWTPDTSVAPEPGMWDVLGFHGAILIGALVNAAAIWAFVRFLVRRPRGSAGLAGA